MRPTPIIESYMNWLDSRANNKAPRRLDFSLSQFRANAKNIFALRKADRLNFRVSVGSETLDAIFKSDTLFQGIEQLFTVQGRKTICHLLECAHRDAIPVLIGPR